VVYHYDGANNLTSVQDERHSTANTAYAYDPTNRLASVTQTLSTVSSGRIVTSYVYDVHGNLTSVTDPNGNTTTYLYDDFARILHQVSPVSGTTTYTYDPAGNLTSTTDANGATTARAYDALNRVTSATSSRSGLDTEVVTYAYDETSGGFGLGRLTTMSDPVAVMSYRYDRRGLLTTSTDDIGNYMTTFAYDADGNRRSLGYPSSRNVQTTFDFAGRPVTESSNGTSVITSASYLPFGPMTSMVYGNGTTKTMLFDSRYRPQENKLTTATAVIADYLYQEDAGGNITQIHDATSAAYNRDFAYDDLNRLTTANSGTSLWGNGSYQYDAMGNMTTQHVGSRTLSFSYVGSTPRIQTVTGSSPASVAYDNSGNEVQQIGNEALGSTYGPRNLLLHVSGDPGSDHFDYSYDGRGVRIFSAWTSGGPGQPWGFTRTRKSIYSPELHLIGQSDWEGLTMDGVFNGTEYIWFGDQPVAQTFTDPSLPTRYTFTDHLGTPLLQTDSTATVVWRAEYEPYGGVYTYRVGDESDPQALRLPGQEADPVLGGQKYNIFRWYRSEWGRYTQADPITNFERRRLWSYRDPSSGIRGIPRDSILLGENEYGYSRGNPLVVTDSLGLCSSCSSCPSPPIPASGCPWQTPYGPSVAQAYGNAIGGPFNNNLNGVSKTFPNDAWSNCVRGCLLCDWNPCKKEYRSGFYVAHARCYAVCALAFAANNYTPPLLSF